MINSITVAYPSSTSSEIRVQYAIEQLDSMQTINCSVEGTSFPIWLQLRKFSMSSLKEYGRYTPLFNEINNSKNMDTSLFIDLVYSSIMKTEHFKCQ